MLWFDEKSTSNFHIFRFVLSNNNLTHLIPSKDAVLHMNSHRSEKELKDEVEKDDDGKIKAANRTKKYFQMLTNESVQRLYNLYKLDFELFQYSLDEILWWFDDGIIHSILPVVSFATSKTGKGKNSLTPLIWQFSVIWKSF